MRLAVFVVVNVVHQGHEFGDGLVELDVFELLLLHAVYLHAERQHPLHMAPVVRDVKVRLRHVILDKLPRLGHQLPDHRSTQRHCWFPPSPLLLLLGSIPLLLLLILLILLPIDVTSAVVIAG